MVPRAPASRSGIKVTDSSPSKGPGRLSPRALTSVCSLSAACGTSILAYRTWGTHRTRSMSRLIGSGVGDKGASCTMMGMSIAPATCVKYSITAGPATASVAPKKGGMSITIAAPMSCAARLRAAATRAL